MILNGNKSTEVSDNLVSDIVIVGAGTIGLYMASRLLKKSPEINIIIIESGDIIPSKSFNIKSSLSVGKYHKGTLHSRYSGIGGTSAAWTGGLVEFVKEDFERIDCPWPIGYEELKYYYNEVYSFLKINNISSYDGYNKIYGVNQKHKQNLDSIYVHILKQSNLNFAKYFKNEIKSKNITIISNTTANKIVFNKNVAYEIECRTGIGRNIKIQGKKFIFASGTIGINQFFLTTKLFHDVPWKSNDFIGKYFQDHLKGTVGRLIIGNIKVFNTLFEDRIIKGNRVKHRLILNPKLINGVMVVFTNKSKKEESFKRIKVYLRKIHHDIKINDLKILIGDLYLLRSYIFKFALKRIFTKKIHRLSDNILVEIQSEQIPIEESFISVSKDEILDNGLNKVNVNWDWDGNEINAIHELTYALNKYLIVNNIGKVKVDKRLCKNSPEFLNSFVDTSHQCGGMRMSHSDKNGVVDSNCKVWGTDNVWVGGSAVFPSSSFANSTLTALALADRIIQNSI